MFDPSEVSLQIWVALFGVLIVGSISIVWRILEWLQKERLPRLGQKMTSEDLRRITLLIVIDDVELEIRKLLKQAIDEGIAIENLPKLHVLLQRVYMHPDRYQRFPDIRDASVQGHPLPYEG